MTIYRYGRDGLISYNLTDDELMRAYMEYQTREDEMTIIGVLDAAGYDVLCNELESNPCLLRDAAQKFRQAIEFSYDGDEELDFVLDSCECAAERRSA